MPARHSQRRRGTSANQPKKVRQIQALLLWKASSTFCLLLLSGNESLAVVSAET